MASKKVSIKSVTLADAASKVPFIDFSEIRDARPELTDWQSTIDRIDTQHKRIYKFTASEVLERFPTFTSYFVDVVNWLNGNSQLNNFINIAAPTGGISGIDQTMLNNLRDSWVPNLESSINNDQQFIYFEQIHTEIKNEVAKIGTIQTDAQFEKTLERAQQEFNQLIENVKDEVNSTKKAAISELKTAKGLDEWVKYYEGVESDYTILIEGSHYYKFSLPFTIETLDNRKKLCLQIPVRRIEKPKSEYSTITSKKIGEAKKRLYWFLALVIVIGVPAILGLLNFSEVFGYPNPFYIDKNAEVIDYKLIAVEKLKYLPLLVVVAYGYAFTNKNYRILSNLREQYRHRKTVSVTLQGIIAAFDENSENKDIRVKLVEIGAKAMFELKTIGHLTKKDSDSSPLAEIVQTIVPK